MDAFRTLIPAADIQRRIDEIAAMLAAEYPDLPPCVVMVIEGARTFTSHLLPRLGWPAAVAHEIRASSYGATTRSSGNVEVTGGDAVPVAGRRVLLLEDIVDTGRTVDRLRGYFLARGARDVAVATLLSKPDRREVEVELQHVGFEIPNEFVIGFGMDFDGRYRELDRIAVYDAARDDAVRDSAAPS